MTAPDLFDSIPSQARRRHRSRIEELTHGLRERLGLLVLEIVAATREQLQVDAFDRFCEGRCVRGGNDRIAVAPEDRDWRERGDLVRALQEVAALPAPIDDIAHRSGKCTRRTGLRIDRAQLGDVRRRQHVTKALQR